MTKFLMLILMSSSCAMLPERSIVFKNIVTAIKSKFVKPKPLSIYRPHVAIIRIEAVNSALDCLSLIKTIKLAAEQNDALFFYINCSGGSVSLFTTLTDAINKICKDKVVVAYIEDALSGGYSLASACKHLVCNPLGSIGSIGTVNYYTPPKDSIIIQEGKYKTCGNELTDGQLSRLKLSCKDSYIKFCKIIAERRNLNLDDIDKWADGKSFSAEEALDLGLIDEIGYFSDAIEALKSKLKNKGFNVDNGIIIWFNVTDYQYLVL